MSESIIVALITGGLTLLGVIYSARKNQVEMFAKLDKQSELSDAKLDKEIAVLRAEIMALSDEVHRHNNFAEKIPALEEKAKAADRRLTNLEHRGGAA